MVFINNLITAAFAFVGESSSRRTPPSSSSSRAPSNTFLSPTTSVPLKPRSINTLRVPLWHLWHTCIQDEFKLSMSTTTASDSNSNSSQDANIDTSINTSTTSTCTSFEDLYKSFGREELVKLISLQSSEDGDRGIYLNNNIEEDGLILKVPLKHCVRDDAPPSWFDEFVAEEAPCNFDDDEDNPHHYNPSAWATRLAASLVDMQIRSTSTSSSTSTTSAEQNWLSLMPNEEFLRASLPIHWPDDVISNSKCTALEIATDAAYFARAEAVADITTALQSPSIAFAIEENEIDAPRLINNALDLVRTRSCRVERLDGVQLCPPLRVVAPVFDFINHGSSRYGGKGSSNAYFGMEVHDDDGEVLVVRARRDIQANEEILIDYGDSARPAWRCLSSYGFVPNYRVSGDEYFEGEEECVAEVYFNGKRYEVSTDTIPTELVEAAQVSYLEEEEGVRAFTTREEEEETLLTPEVALRLSKRLSDAAFDLMISHPEDERQNEIEPDSDHKGHMKIAKDLQKLLCWSQHKVLLSCTLGLRDYAARSMKLPP